MGAEVPNIGRTRQRTIIEGERDFVVVGAGIAGSAAATRAAELGLRTLLLDKGSDPSGSGNAALSGGSLHIAYANLKTAPNELFDRIMNVTEGRSRPDQAKAVATNAARALEWLSTQGVEFEQTTDPAEAWRSLLAPRRLFTHVSLWKEAGPQRALQRLQARVRELGGEVVGGTTVRRLIKERSRVTGIVTEKGDIISARAVVLADGGFSANPTLRRKYIGPAADRIFVRGVPQATGDGLAMGLEAGAAATSMQWFYGHLLHSGAMENDRLWPMPLLDDLLEQGILVDARGRRLTDESLGGVAAANAIAQRDDPLHTYLVLDNDFWTASYREPDTGWNLPANPELERRGGVVHYGRTVNELAALASIEAGGLTHTLEQYNAAIVARKGDHLSVPRTGSERPLRCRLLAIPVVPGITMTLGGLVIDGRARVLDGDGHWIVGLYAAGGTAGGLQGGARGGWVGGLAPALIFGLLSAEDAAYRRL